MIALWLSLAFGSSLDRNMLQQPIRDALPEIRACYEDGLRRDPELSGKVVVRYLVDPDGTIARASLVDRSSTLRDERTEVCILRVMGKLRYRPAFRGRISVTDPCPVSTGEPK